MSLLDTSILIYAANADCKEHDAARNLLKKHVESPETWHLAWQNVFEFIWAVTHPRKSPKSAIYIDEAIDMVRNLLATPSLQIIQPGPRHFEIFADLAGHTPGIRGHAVHDARLAALMIENGVRKIYTADDSFSRFRGIHVVNVFRS